VAWGGASDRSSLLFGCSDKGGENKETPIPEQSSFEITVGGDEDVTPSGPLSLQDAVLPNADNDKYYEVDIKAAIKLSGGKGPYTL
jgi:hypothetical protein